MAQIIHRRKTCRLCGSTELDIAFQLAPSPIGDAYVTADRLGEFQPLFPIDQFICRECGLAQLLDVIAPEVLYGDYIYVTASSLGLETHFQRYADSVLETLRPRSGSLVIDIGSNDGTLLRAFKDRGMRTLGVEPAQHIAEAATEAGVETIGRFFTPDLAREIRSTHGAASIITANNVFANVDDLHSMTTGIRELLSPDGIFVCESYYIADVVKNMVFDFIYHEHISSFAVTPLCSFFKRMGMRLIDVKRVPTKGGSLRYMVGLADGPHAEASSVREMLAQEQREGVCDPRTYHAFSDRIDELRDRTVNLLIGLKNSGHSIAGFGASITVTTLIYHFGIGQLLEYLVDDNKAKQGLFSPGLHLPVYPGSALEERKPDDTVILAWRYAEPIIRKHAAYLSAGGRFIVPVPEVKVIDHT